MIGADTRQVATQNLRDFREMSYSDVYALIREKRFDEAQEKYAAVLQNMGVDQFDSATALNITTPHDALLECMSEMASGVSEPEKIRAVGFDLSAHAIHQNDDGNLSQGIEVSLYSEDVYDFAGASDEQITEQCERSASEWQGCFMEINSLGLEGLGAIAEQFADHAQNDDNALGIIENEEGAAIVDPIAIAKHVAKLLVAVEYHRYMAEFVSEVEVPSEMVFIIGEHDEIEVPIVFYRVGEDQSDTNIDDQLDLPPVEALEPLLETQELAEEETPALYHATEEVVAEEELQKPDLGMQLYEQAKAQVVETIPAEPEIEHVEQPVEGEFEVLDTEIQIEPNATDAPEEEPLSAAQASLGKSLAPKTFGQRSNEMFNDGSENDDTEEEQSA